MSTAAGRHVFEIREEDRDYSGLTIASRYLENADLSKSFFNGVNFSDCAFQDVDFAHTEFSEANLRKSSMTKCVFRSSDLVDCRLDSVHFTDCSMEHGEWRESLFVGCTFAKCNFDHITMTLCSFIRCDFDAISMKTLEHRAAYYNTFSKCSFGASVDRAFFFSRNFGVPGKTANNELVSRSAPPIELVCLSNNSGVLHAVDLADAAEAICQALKQRMVRNSTLIFFAKIVRVVTDEGRISATTLLYLENVIAQFASKVSDQDLFTSAVSTMVEIRSALFALAAHGRTPASDASATADRIIIHFDESFSRKQANILRRSLAIASGHDNDALELTSFSRGSTLIELVGNGLMSLGIILVTLNFVLHQAKVTVERSGKLYRAAQKALQAPKPRRRRTISKDDKLPAVMQTGPVLEELSPVRKAVHEFGKELIAMDVPCTVIVVSSTRRWKGRED